MLYSFDARFSYHHIAVDLVSYHGCNGRRPENGREDIAREVSGAGMEWIGSESIVLYQIGLYSSVVSCIDWIHLLLEAWILVGASLCGEAMRFPSRTT